MYRFHPIGRIHSCFPQKFGIPRQAGLVPQATAVLELFAPYGRAEALAGLEEFSHLWVVFGWSSSFTPTWIDPGIPRCGRPGWAATAASASSLPAAHSGPTPSECRRCAWRGFAADPPPLLPVAFSPEAEAACRRIDDGGLKDLIAGVLANDPRPAYMERTDGRAAYGMRICDLEVRWRVREERVEVLTVAPVPAGYPSADEPSTSALEP